MEISNKMLLFLLALGRMYVSSSTTLRAVPEPFPSYIYAIDICFLVTRGEKTCGDFFVFFFLALLISQPQEYLFIY